ncbi:AMP-binding protein [Pseudooceanicola sp. CBS1P-1]|uniref:AMP-binding protein n=1 Tax=Pseudooceanicola albus TaxID=2692189 RepID=A0A6L7GAE7_9RHOB|nr:MULTISPECIES: AMP-binding protein [Pseudooceanicola]MBT9386240.1 AMP-binding protein [Pseudooceanicola endophyticus]MXN20290.1 AMP-binding protein [Pseudooceanicola albus]
MSAPGLTAARLIAETHQGFAARPGLACRTRSGDLSFAALHAASAALAGQLASLPGATARRPVLIWGHKDLRYPIAWWACLLAGMALVPVERDTPEARIRQIARTCGAGACLVADAAPGAAARLRALLDLPVLEVDPAATPATALPPCPARPEDVAYIMFSSGTLGQPKGIRINHANLADFVLWLDDLLPEPVAGVSGTIRHCFDVSLFELWTGWRRGVPLSALDHGDFADSTGYIARLATDRTGLWVSTPSIIRLMLKNRRFTAATLPALRTFLFCGEPLTRQIVATLFERFPGARVINTYGPTECTVAVTSVDITPAHLADGQALPIGRARPGTTLTTPDGAAQGEIMIAGRSVGPGYLGQPDRQARAFPAPGHYRSGDQGRCDADGTWHFLGRQDREVKIQGMRIDLNEVEAHIRAQPGVEDVIVEPHMLRGEARALNAYVLGAGRPDLPALAATLARDLPPWLVPRFWYAGFDAGLNANSKLDRRQLARAADDATWKHVHVAAPQPLS